MSTHVCPERDIVCKPGCNFIVTGCLRLKQTEEALTDLAQGDADLLDSVTIVHHGDFKAPRRTSTLQITDDTIRNTKLLPYWDEAFPTDALSDAALYAFRDALDRYETMKEGRIFPRSTKAAFVWDHIVQRTNFIRNAL